MALLYAEFTNFIRIEQSVFHWIFEKDLGYFATYALVILPLFYMLLCTYYGLFSIKIASWYELYKGHSDPVSMIWSGTLFARMIYPMSYNFITILKVKNTNYSEVLTILEDFSILGEGVNNYLFPIILIVFFAMNLFSVWSFLFNLCGLSQYAFDELETESRIKEGRITVSQRKKDWFISGDIDEAFMKYSYSSDEDGATSPTKNGYPSFEKSSSNFLPKSKNQFEYDKTPNKRTSFKLNLNDSESSGGEFQGMHNKTFMSLTLIFI